MSAKAHRLLDALVDESGCAPVLAVDLRTELELCEKKQRWVRDIEVYGEMECIHGSTRTCEGRLMGPSRMCVPCFIRHMMDTRHDLVGTYR